MSALLSAAGTRAEADPIAGVFLRVGREAATRPDFISMASGAPDNALLPRAAVEALIAEALARHGAAALNYTDPQGFAPLRVTLAQALALEGIDCPAENLLVTSGGMEAVSLAAQAMLDPGDVVLVEDPTFPAALSLFRLYGAHVVHVPCDDEGLRADALETAIETHRPKLLSVMTDFQNPTGRRMSRARREAVADVVRRAGLLVIEDGVYAPLRFGGEMLPPLHRLAPGQVAYCASLSKVLFPAARIGALAAPDALLKRCLNIKTSFNLQASTWLQAVAQAHVEQELRAGSPALAVLRTRYAERCRCMMRALEEHFGERRAYGWTRPEGGMFLWFTAPPAVDFGERFEEALAAGVAYVPGALFHADERGRNAVRLNFASLGEARIAEGVRRLAGLLAA